jgi:hypothetical protein
LAEYSTNPLGFADLGHRIIPVELREENGKWRKHPLREWDQATTDHAVIAWWWRLYPNALPAIPLRYSNLVVVDADKREGIDGVAKVTNIGPLGPHSRVNTPSGGVHLVFAQPKERIENRFRWCEGVEIIGSSGLLTCYDLDELAFPRVAPRAILPERFWKPVEGEGKQNGSRMIKDRRDVIPPPIVDVEVNDLTSALWKMNVEDWRGDYEGWLGLLNAAQFVGISKREFLRWSLTDPVYAADERSISRIWDSAKPEHRGALYAAFKARGIKIAKGPTLYHTGPVQQPSGPTRNFNDRANSLYDWLNANPSEPNLFKTACVFGEMISEGHLKPSTAIRLLSGNCAKLRRAMGADAFRETISRALARHSTVQIARGLKTHMLEDFEQADLVDYVRDEFRRKTELTLGAVRKHCERKTGDYRKIDQAIHHLVACDEILRVHPATGPGRPTIRWRWNGK